MIKSVVLPILLSLITILVGIYWTGKEATPQGIMAILETCDARAALLWGSFVMALTGIILSLSSKIMTFDETMSCIVYGFKLMVLTGAIFGDHASPVIDQQTDLSSVLEFGIEFENLPAPTSTPSILTLFLV